MPHKDFNSNFLNDNTSLPLFFKIEQITYRLVQKFAFSYVQTLPSEKANVEAYIDYATDKYGIVNERLFINSPDKKPDDLKDFLDYLDENLTPKQIIDLLIIEINSDVQYIDIQLQFFFKKPEKRVCSSELIEQITPLIDQFNEKYTPLVELSIHSLLHVVDNEIRLLPYNKMELIVKTVKGFRKLFLSETAFQFERELGENKGCLFYDHGVIWIENQLAVYPCTQAVLNTLDHNGTNVLWLLAANKQFLLIEQLIKEELITLEQLLATPHSEIYAGVKVNVLWLLAFTKQYHLIEHLMAKELITPEQLLPAPQTKVNAGKNVLWLLTVDNQFPLIECLIVKKLITPEQLLAMPQAGVHAGKNVLWIFAAKKQFPLIERLMDERMILQEPLLTAPLSGINTGKNVLWILIFNNQFSLINRLMNEGLITEKQLLAAAQSGVLADIKQHSFIERLTNRVFIRNNIKKCSMEKNSNLTALAENPTRSFNDLVSHLPELPPPANSEQPSVNDSSDSKPNFSKKKADNKIAYFSKKYYSSEDALQEIYCQNEHNDIHPIEFTCRHQLIPLTQALNTETKSDLYVETIESNDFLNCTLLSYYAAEEKYLSDQTVTFIFAGRLDNAYLPNLNHMGQNQQCIVVLTSGEYRQLSIKSVPKSLGFLVINKLDSMSHGEYLNTGTIQARRLAAFYASHHWQLNNCIYLDDNIEWIGLKLELLSPVLNWSDVTNYLRENRERSHSLIAGLHTLSNKVFSHKTPPDYCYKIYSINFQCICALLDLKEKEDIFILGYPATYANICTEDFFFQMMIDFANDSKNNSQQLLHLADPEQAGIKRSVKKQGLAKKLLQPYQDVLNMNIELFISNLFNEQHKEWITLSLSHLKKQAKFNKNKFEEHQKYERTRSDLPSCALKTAAITKRKLEHLIMESMEDMHAEPTKTASSKKKKTQHNTKKTTQWTPCFSGMSLSNLMSIGKLPLATYLSDISHLCYAYQQEALKVIAQTNRVQGVLKIATGAGKTRLQILLANYLVANKVNGPIYIVTATQQLVDQFYLDFEETLELLGVQAHLNMLDIIKVKSGSGNVPWMNYWANDILKKQTKVVLFCQESYDKLQHKLSEVPLANYIPPAIVFLDEFHLYTATADILLGSKATIVGFSATPPKNVSPIYSFSRLDSLQCGITVPMIIDKLPYQLNNTNEKRTQKIAELIKNHSHPSNGRPLKESKGVIFVSSIEEADQLATSLNQLLSKNLLFSVHSKLNNYNTLIATFQKKELDSPGILIVVGMLQTGYNDKNLSWCIIARNKNENSTMVQQIIGRVLRKNPAHPNKIAYIIADTHLNIHEFGPLRDDAALKLASNEYFKTNHQIIYLDILRAIKAGEPFKSYQLLFELNRLQRHSLKKHLELLLNTDKQDWLEGMCRWNQQLTNEEGYKQDLLFCFAHEAYGFLSDKQKTEHKELYTAKRFSVLLGTLNQFLPNKLTSWLARTGEKSCAYYVKTMKNKYGCNEYWNVFNEYQQIANTSIYPRRLEDTRTHQPKDKDTSSTMHRLFSPKPKHEELVINTSYQYEVEDIQAILRLRLDSCHVPGLKILAAADMTGNYVGNRVVDVLQQYMTGLEGQMAKNSAVEQNIIIPIAYNAHWVGIRLQLKIGLAPQITYYNSIKGYESDTELMSQILNEVNQVFDGHAVPVMHYFAKCLEQNDGTSCGAFLIENIYSDLKQGNWRLSTANILTKAIRERHLKLLHDYDPNFYNGFYERQATNQPAAFDEDFIL